MKRTTKLPEKITQHQINELRNEKIAKEAKYLELEPYDMREARSEQVQCLISDYLEKIKLTGSEINYSVFSDLLDASYDIDSQIYDLEANSIDLLMALGNPEVAKLISPYLLPNAVKMLYGLNRFAKGLQEEYRRAELQITFLDYDGAGNLPTMLALEQEYQLKLQALDIAEKLATS